MSAGSPLTIREPTSETVPYQAIRKLGMDGPVCEIHACPCTRTCHDDCCTCCTDVVITAQNALAKATFDKLKTGTIRDRSELVTTATKPSTLRSHLHDPSS